MAGQLAQLSATTVALQAQLGAVTAEGQRRHEESLLLFRRRDEEARQREGESAQRMQTLVGSMSVLHQQTQQTQRKLSDLESSREAERAEAKATEANLSNALAKLANSMAEIDMRSRRPPGLPELHPSC